MAMQLNSHTLATGFLIMAIRTNPTAEKPLMIAGLRTATFGMDAVGIVQKLFGITDATQTLHFDMLATAQNAQEALAVVESYEASYLMEGPFTSAESGIVPGVNLTSKTGRPGAPVRDMQTGQIYGSSAEAAMALGVSPSAMSSHLARRPGRATLRGRTFERVI